MDHFKGVSRPIYVNVDSPNLGFTYFNFLGGGQLKKPPCIFQYTCLNVNMLCPCLCVPICAIEQLVVLSGKTGEISG